MGDLSDVPPNLTVGQFLDWTPPPGFETHRWHLMDGEPVLMPALGYEQAALVGEANWTLMARSRGIGTSTRAGTMVAVRAGASETNLYVAAIALTRSPATGSRLMPDPVLLVEVASPENKMLVRVGVSMCKRAPSVEEIVVLDGARVAAALHRRDENGDWEEYPVRLGPEDRLRLRTINLDVPLSQLYRHVDIGKEGNAQLEEFTAVPHPGEVIKRECLDVLGLSVPDAAAHLGVSRSRLADVVAGVDRIDADLAVRLGMAFKRREHEWMRMQQDHDLAQVRRDEIEVSYLVPPHLDQEWGDHFDEPCFDDDGWRQGDAVPREGMATYWCLHESDERGCHAWIPDLPGCSAQAATRPLTLVELACAAEVWIARREATGRPVPPPRTADVLKQEPLVVLALSGGAQVRLLSVRTGRAAMVDMDAAKPAKSPFGDLRAPSGLRGDVRPEVGRGGGEDDVPHGAVTVAEQPAMSLQTLHEVMERGRADTQEQLRVLGEAVQRFLERLDAAPSRSLPLAHGYDRLSHDRRAYTRRPDR